MMMGRKWLVLFIICILALSCAKEEKVLVFWVDPDTDIYIDFLENEKTFYVYNIYHKSVSWEVSHKYDFLSVYPQSGILELKDSVKITISIDRGLIEDIPGSIDLHPAGKRFSSSLILKSSVPKSSEVVGFNIKYYNYDYWKMQGEVLDAKYDRINDLLILIQKDPHIVKIINPEEREFQTVELFMTPTSLSVSLDGQFAVIGHLGWFSLLNLHTLEIENIYHVPVEVSSLIIAPNNWVYLYTGDWVYGFDLENEVIADGFLSTIPIKGEGAALHPTGSHIYLPGWPDMLVRHSIEQGPVEYDGISDYAEYYDCTYLWISDDGLRLFTNHNHVINTNQDLSYVSTLEGRSTTISALDHHSGAGKIALTRCSSGSVVNCGDLIIYNDQSLKIEQELAIPMYLPTTLEQVILKKMGGRYGFFNSDGSRFYLLASRDSPNVWIMISYDID